jgi:hypothetical protein
MTIQGPSDVIRHRSLLASTAAPPTLPLASATRLTASTARKVKRADRNWYFLRGPHRQPLERGSREPLFVRSHEARPMRYPGGLVQPPPRRARADPPDRHLALLEWQLPTVPNGAGQTSKSECPLARYVCMSAEVPDDREVPDSPRLDGTHLRGGYGRPLGING